MDCRRDFRAAFGRAGALGRSRVTGESKKETGRRRRGGDTRGPLPLLTRVADLSATSISQKNTYGAFGRLQQFPTPLTQGKEDPLHISDGPWARKVTLFGGMCIVFWSVEIWALLVW
jgi:hypothetical protein